MAAHSRHCAKHKKPLPCPHCAMIQKPAAPVEPLAQAPAPAPMPATPAIDLVSTGPPKPKRGRPPKFGTAMSPTERKRRERANAKAKTEDKERRDLAAKIMRKFRAGASKSIQVSKEGAAARSDRKVHDELNERQYLNHLLTLPAEELQKVWDILRDSSDSKGTLPGETSGGNTRRDGQDRMERIDGRRETASLRPTKPAGRGASSDVAPEESADSADVSYTRESKKNSINVKLPSDSNYLYATRDTAIERRVHELFGEHDGGVVRECCDVLRSPKDMSDHLFERFNTGVRQLDYLATILEMTYLDPLIVTQAENALKKNLDFYVLRLLVARIEKEEKDKGKLARRLERRGKEAAAEFKRQERERLDKQAQIENWGTEEQT